MAMSSATLRYVPQGAVSLSSDAPGWSIAKEKDEQTKGPTCWKCKGMCFLPLQKKQKLMLQKVSVVNKSDAATDDSSTTITTHQQHNQRTCPVCKGKGHLPIRSKYLQSQTESGVITSRRRRPKMWKEFGHIPPAVQAMLLASSDGLMREKNNGSENDDATNTMMDHSISFLSRASGCDDDYDTKRKDVSVIIPSSENGSNQQLPQWLPSNPGEQLCNLVGRWRILQRVASHRWTTDDLVTAYVAASTFVSSRRSNNSSTNNNEGEKATIRYLDLGTGNASVLQMATWYLLSSLQNADCQLEAVGVEARSEAVGLARRSLSFNLGAVEHKGRVYTGGLDSSSTDAVPMDNDVRIVQGDFRDLVSLSSTNSNGGSSSSSNVEEGKDDDSWTMESVASKRYDLITGTPPYFRVDFTSSNQSAGNKKATAEASSSSNNDEVITSAIIQQGGMPTSMQSAPARCEFRGGIEAYCLTASAMLSPRGQFVVCENWLNNDRVWKGAEEAGLAIEYVLPVMGKVGRGNLFAVYVMKKKSKEHGSKIYDEVQESKVRPPLIVRGENGKWTKGYEEVMGNMSIPMV